MIATTDAEKVLGLLGAAFPAYPVGEDTYDLYLAALAAPPIYDLSTLVAAVGEWVAHNDRYPTIHQLVDAYQAEARRRILARQAAEQARAEATGTLPGMPGPLGADTALEMVDVMRTVLDEIGGAPHIGHTKHGPGTCLTCLSGDEITDRAESRVFQLLEERGIRPPGQPVGTYACGLCLDTAFETVDHDRGTVAPCRDCNPDGYRRWLDGHYRPGHWCSDCDSASRGR
jgi:hypothetical protein